MIKKLFIFFLLLTAKVLSQALIPPEIDRKIDNHLAEHTKYMKENHEASCYGVGHGMFDDLAHLSLDYYIDKTVDLKEARKTYILSRENLLNRFRHDKEIRPYLHKFPIKGRMICCSLKYKARKKQEKISNEVDLISSGHTTIDFSSYFPEGTEYPRFETVSKETYEEALRIVKEEMGEDFPKFGSNEIAN